MRENLDLLGGLVFSQQILLLLTQNGFSRESAYEIVQSSAMEVWKTPSDKRKDLFQKLLLRDTKNQSKVSKENN